MRFDCAALLALSSALLAHAAPFSPRDGTLQRNRRRAIDYPLQSQTSHNAPTRHMRKRSVNYSVVQVDGGSSTNTSPPAPAATLIETVTEPAVTQAPITETVLVTSVATGSVSEETIVVTTTQVRDVQQTVTTSVSIPVELTTTASASISTTTQEITAQRSDSVTTSIATSVQTVTASAPTSSVSYYDNGLWHTSYPIKTFPTPTAGASEPTGPVSYYNLGLWQTSYTAVASSAITSTASSSPTPSTGYGSEAHPSVQLNASQPIRRRSVASKVPRKAPEDLKLASFNITRLEIEGMRRFKN